MAPTTTLNFLHRRYNECRFVDGGYVDDDDCYMSYWSTKEGMIVKWSLFLGFIVACLLYLLIGYIHAHQRIKKGLPPLSYHRFLISRDVLARVDPRYRPPPPPHPYARPSSSGSASNRYYPWAPGPQYVDMYAMPPPMYDPNAPRPPKYEPPAPAPASAATAASESDPKVESSSQPSQGQGQPAGAPPAWSPSGQQGTSSSGPQ
ncbi:hypothetical protein VTJ49DRAFT_7260 [Mycothermus thermophilus]|uniref:Uncharacterized protein n=1 Tax=Humicola insolens TaxID=85995 RepID=A0ABR3VHV5_HUMIN